MLLYLCVIVLSFSAAVYAHYMQQQYQAMRSSSTSGLSANGAPSGGGATRSARPPDYVTATNMTRRKQQAPLPPTAHHSRAHSFESYIHAATPYVPADDDVNERLVDGKSRDT